MLNDTWLSSSSSESESSTSRAASFSLTRISRLFICHSASWSSPLLAWDFLITSFARLIYTSHSNYAKSFRHLILEPLKLVFDAAQLAVTLFLALDTRLLSPQVV